MVVEVRRNASASASASACTSAAALVALVLVFLAQLAAANTEISVFGPVFCADTERFENTAPRLTRSWCVTANRPTLFSSTTTQINLTPGVPAWVVLSANYDDRTAFYRYGAQHAVDRLFSWVPDQLWWALMQRYTLRISWPANVRVC